MKSEYKLLELQRLRGSVVMSLWRDSYYHAVLNYILLRWSLRKLYTLMFSKHRSFTAVWEKVTECMFNEQSFAVSFASGPFLVWVSVFLCVILCRIPWRRGH
jgi:hypothetical protein